MFIANNLEEMPKILKEIKKEIEEWKRGLIKPLGIKVIQRAT